MLLWGLLAFAAFYGIKAATATSKEEKDKANKRASNNLVGAGIVFVIAMVLLAAISAS